ncbi:hypothetical protein [Nonomuraea jiangxiensis]|uniref:Small secreted domain n=1 Tax=Nonomuraea jiangxiensis TaxID=633440 RepID=A0A1G9NPN9_9ACTN|nr:hypothetical protein [Nonomuraea jiangxiensis]SDL88359.1 hypothetical protein SAMN05421869_13260 [Nonomuraea jiangxiensis]
MMKKLCVTGLVAAAAGMTLLSAPALADTNAGNSSSNRNSSQSGNNFGNVASLNLNGYGATGVNNVNGNAVTGTNGSDVVVDDVVD